MRLAVDRRAQNRENPLSSGIDVPSSESSSHRTIDFDDQFASLVDRAVAGDRVAIGDLLFDHYSIVARHLQRKIPKPFATHCDVDDLVQQVFVAVIGGLEGLSARTRQGFAAWLETVADSTLQTSIRTLKCLKRGGGRSPQRITGRADASSWHELVVSLVNKSSTGSSRAAREEAVQAVRVAVSILPEDQRRAVQIHHLHGKSVPATAAEMTRTSGAVRGLLQRARSELRAALGRSSRWFAKK
jgi:RNA polymerase sigma-70 factor, ECF subfamily